MQLQIIKEEKNYIVINKPAGIVVHSDGRTRETTLCDLLIEKYPEIVGVGEPLKISDGKGGQKIIERHGIVHRLDRETSGVMLVARTVEGFSFLKDAFKNRLVQKTYQAFVYGNVREDKFQISEPIGRSPKDFRQRFSGKKVKGKLRSALTFFRVLKRSAKKDLTFIEAQPKTGRTHQIRVHLKFLGAPVVADSLYASSREPRLGFKRLALHSYKIEFVDVSGQKREYVADYPEDFSKAIADFS